MTAKIKAVIAWWGAVSWLWMATFLALDRVFDGWLLAIATLVVMVLFGLALSVIETDIRGDSQSMRDGNVNNYHTTANPDGKTLL